MGDTGTSAGAEPPSELADSAVEAPAAAPPPPPPTRPAKVPSTLPLGMSGHPFLFKKAWHPATFRNREMVWAAEERIAAEARRDAAAREEVAAERAQEAAAALLPEAERGRRAVGWIYAKPPGYDAGLERAAAAPPPPPGATPAAGGNRDASAGAAPAGGGGRRGGRQAGPVSHVARVVGGVRAAAAAGELQLKAGRAHGGGLPGDANQRLIAGASAADEAEEEAALRLAAMEPREVAALARAVLRQGAAEARRAAREARAAAGRAEAARVEEALAFLQASGVAVPGAATRPREKRRRRRSGDARAD
jgi:hypothetical protein